MTPAFSFEKGPRMLGRASLKMGTPWAVSLAIHLALLGIIALVAFRVAFEPPAPDERYIDFDETAAEPMLVDPPSTAHADHALPSAAELPESPPREPLLPPRRATSAPTPPPPATDTAGGDAPMLDSSLTAAPLSGSPATAQGDAGTALPARAPVGGDVKFAGLGSSNARSVVYAVDASGPMVSTLREVIDELDRSVSRLSASQKFGVVAFGGAADPGTTSFMPVLVRATPQAKQQLREWLLGLAPSGRSNPLAGLRAALKLKPDAVFLLSRGIERSGGGVWELGLDSTMEELDTLNPVNRRTGRRPVVIKTIQFLDEDPTGTMQRIGQLHGSTTTRSGAKQPGYRVVQRGSELTDEPVTELEP